MIIGGQRIEEAVRALHAHPIKAVFYYTGGGVGLLPLLWEPGGMSRTVLDAGCPYDRIPLVDKIEAGPDEGKCRPETAVAMAVAAYEWVEQICQRNPTYRGSPIVGLGITAALRTDPPRSRPDWFHAAALGPNGMRTVDVTFEQGGPDRLEQGRWTDLVGLSLLLDAAGLENLTFRRPWGVGCDQLGPESYGVQKLVPKGHDQLFAIDPTTFWDKPLHWPYGLRAEASVLDPNEHVLFPGSFHPLQYAHVQSAKMVEAQTGKTVVFCTTANHPTKGDLPMDELIKRRMGLRWRHPLLFTKNDGLFIEKARAFPGFSFLIGADVMVGILDPKYYDGLGGRDAALNEFQKLGTRFLVVGREVPGRGYLTHKHIVANVPIVFRDLFEPVSGRWDISSTDLR